MENCKIENKNHLTFSEKITKKYDKKYSQNTYKNYGEKRIKNKEKIYKKSSKNKCTKIDKFFKKDCKFFANFCYLFLAVIFVIISTLFVVQHKNSDNFFGYFSRIENAEFCYVVNDNFTDKKDVRIVSTMNCQFVYFNKTKDDFVGADIKYKQVSFPLHNFDEKSVLENLNISITKREYVNGISIIYGYSPNFAKSICVGNAKINFQFAINDQTVTIGYPMIFGAF